MWYSSQSVSGLAPILQAATVQEATLKRATRKARFSRYHNVLVWYQLANRARDKIGGALVALSWLGATSLAHAEGTPKLDTGDTAWVLISTALVLMMTVPGLALFYAGMVRKKNILGTMAHSLGAAALVSVVWVVAGYSLAFSHGTFNPFIGGLDNAFLAGIGVQDVTGTIPTLLYVGFQMTFAIIAVAILAGSLAERMKFGSFMVFSALWLLLVYAPVCHWVWGGGWLMGDGAMDFAGGTVVHINAGMAGLVLASVLGHRQGYGRVFMAPANLTLTMVGTGLLWVGWFGFNAGSALGANGLAANALLVTQVSAASGALTWFGLEKLMRAKSSVLGGASGAVAGLVGITPAAGFVSIGGALWIGILTTVVCYFSVHYLKRVHKIDDTLDAFGLHGVGGIVGALLTAVFVSPAVTGQPLATGLLHRLWIQAAGVLATLVYCGAVTWLIAKAVQKTLGLRLGDEAEYEGMDLAIHGEKIE